MTTAVPSPASTPTGGRDRLVVHAARHVPMEANAQTRAVAALTALFIPGARHERAGPSVRLDSGAPVKALSHSIDQ
jgi:hypothetical protein